MKYAVAGGILGALTVIVWIGFMGCRMASRKMCAQSSPMFCESPSARGYVMAQPEGGYFPHGGTANPNAEPYAGTFFENYGVNPFIDTEDDHFSTFAINVDTASYTVTRRYLTDGYLPPKDAVRVEEFVNYFKYYYEPPKEDTFAIYFEGAPSKFGLEGYKMLKIGLKAKEVSAKERKDAALVFVIDVSGSMGMENRLGLVKKALRLLLDQMREGDSVGIVVYGTNARVITKPLTIEYRDALLEAIDQLNPEGCTNAQEGLLFGFQMARQFYREGCTNRLILCSDGVANNGVTDAEGLLRKVKSYAGDGIDPSTLGFGMGNYNDVLMEKLADKGNGNYAYIDNMNEARRVFVENLTGTLQVVAKDVKIQVDFNPEVVKSYRLLGYENRNVADEKFRDDTVDGGEVGAGHSVTALYELKMHKSAQGRLATVYVRYKNPDSGAVSEVSNEISTTAVAKRFEEASENFRLAAAVAEFAEILRGSYWARGSNLDNVLALAKEIAPAFDNREDVAELVTLIEKARGIKARETTDTQTPLAGQTEE